MNEQLESDLREALRARAAQVPDGVAGGLTRLDYRPRTRRVRPPVAIGAVASAAVAAGTLAVVISLGAGASNAFAGWSAKPTKPAPGQLAAASAACQRSQASVAGLPLALADTRGPFTFSVYANSESTAACIEGPSFVLLSQSQASSPVTVPADQVLLSGAHGSERGGHAFGFAFGRTGADVSGVTLVLDDGTKVQATVHNGWFVAWWPNAAQLKSAAVTTPAGVSTQALNLSGNRVIRGPHPPIPCHTNKDCANGGSAQSETGGGAKGKGFSFSESGAGSVGGAVQEQGSSSSK